MAEPEGPEPWYRYRTPALVGPWRCSVDAAVEDAIRAGQARLDEAGTILWTSAGRIEVGYRGGLNGAGADD